MTPAIAPPAPLDVLGPALPAPGPADAEDDDAFRSALSALFAMVGGALPAPELPSECAQPTEPRSVETDSLQIGGAAMALAAAGPLFDAPALPPDAEPGARFLDECDATSDPLQHGAKPEPDLPAATVSQVLGFSEALRAAAVELPPVRDNAPQLTPIPARERFAQQSSEQSPAEVLPLPPATTEAPPTAAGQVAFEAVISEALVPHVPESTHTAKPEAPPAEPAGDDAAAQPERAASKDAAPLAEARAVKAAPPQPDGQTRERGRDGSQRTNLDAEFRQARTRPLEAPQISRGAIAPGMHEKGEAVAPSRPRAFAAPAQNTSPAAAIDRMTDARPEPVAVRHLRLQVVPDPARPIDVLVAERAGAVHVSVRTGDAATAGVLRGDLQGLVADLERSGLRAETFAPADAGIREPARAATAEMFGRGQPETGEGQRRWQQQDARPRARKRPGGEEHAEFSLDYGLEKTR